ncbi:replication protein A 70 kDa DNA-binding subunit B-like [Forsythia ovata]|uniref:Replication protein A 70 kDa DNA-binding subunit B-like n=1 Tax=Forsythia ovata TaxID=205694 RepID=A0ABD1SPN3_9LAMI
MNEKRCKRRRELYAERNQWRCDGRRSTHFAVDNAMYMGAYEISESNEVDGIDVEFFFKKIQVIDLKTPTLSPKIAKNESNAENEKAKKENKGNKVQATIYDNNITAFQNKLLLSKTYLVSNATVKHTKAQYRSVAGDVQWTITG